MATAGCMHINIGSNVKVTSGKHAGQQGKLVSRYEDADGAVAEVEVVHKTWLRFFHFMKTVEVRPSELALA
jgi:ribosomal protein L24